MTFNADVRTGGGWEKGKKRTHADRGGGGVQNGRFHADVLNVCPKRSHFVITSRHWLIESYIVVTGPIIEIVDDDNTMSVM